MLHLRFAPSLDLLVPELLAGMRKVWTDPFAPPAVIVPNPAIGTWLKLRLADCPESDERLGCTANLAMPTLERFLWNSLRPDDTTQLLTMEVLQQVVCALLEQHLLDLETYQSLRSYLIADKRGIDPVKRVQLASRIARGFLEYEYNRPSVWSTKTGKWIDENGHDKGIDRTWLNNGLYFRGGNEHESWQKELYCRAVELLRRGREQDTTGYCSLPHLYRERREAAAAGSISWDLPSKTIFLFGVSKVSHFHRNTLVEISQAEGIDLHVLLTNPSAEFWEDVNTSRRPRRIWRHDSEDAGIPQRKPEEYNQEELKDFAHLPRDQELLELWGASGKENVFLWCPQAEWNFEYHCPPWIESEEAPKTLLASVQRALLRRQSGLPAGPGGAWNDDGSLRVLACPDPGREIEELREEILDLVNAKKIDLLNEVAVYLPDPGMYVPYIQRVFGACRPGDPDHIPFAILGTPGSDSVFSQGMQAVFALVEGRFDRAHVFELLRNPLVQASRSISPDQVAVWESWAEKLGIYRGFDRAHRDKMGDRGQAATDAHTFGLGIARMLTGSLAAGPVALDYCLLETGSARTVIPPFRDFDTADSELLEKFCCTIEELHDDLLHFEAEIEQGLSVALDRFVGFIWSWFGTIPETPGYAGAAEGRVRREFVDSLKLIAYQKELAGRNNVPGKELIAHMKSCLPGELPAISSAWVNGITFAPLLPAMVVPHRVIFAAGLDALVFPGSNEKPAWDLLSHKRIIGDADRVRDNRFAFLELLHAARERLVLSFRGRDMQKEEELQPSSVLLELESFLIKNRCVADGEDNKERCAVRWNVPWIVHESFERLRRAGRVHGSWNEINRELARLGSEPVRKRHRRDLTEYDGQKRPVARPEGRENAGPAEDVRTTVFDLRKFFANPLEYHLSKTLGIDLDEEPGTAGATDEPLDSGSLALSTLQKKIWTELLRRVFPPEKADAAVDAEALAGEAQVLAADLYDGHSASGQSPEAQFCRMEKKAFVLWTKECTKETWKLRDRFNDHALRENADLSLGRTGAAGELRVARNGKGSFVIECRHSLVLFPRNAGGAVGIISIKKQGNAADNHELWLAGVLQWMAEGTNGLTIELVQLNRGDGNKAKTGSTFAAMKGGCERGVIDKWLVGMLVDMLEKKCSDHLPFGVIRDLYNKDWKAITADAINDDLAGGHGGYTCYLEAFRLVDARIPQFNTDAEKNDQELQGIAQARFAPLLDRWLHEEVDS